MDAVWTRGGNDNRDDASCQSAPRVHPPSHRMFQECKLGCSLVSKDCGIQNCFFFAAVRLNEEQIESFACSLESKTPVVSTSVFSKVSEEV